MENELIQCMQCLESKPLLKRKRLCEGCRRQNRKKRSRDYRRSERGKEVNKRSREKNKEKNKEKNRLRNKISDKKYREKNKELRKVKRVVYKQSEKESCRKYYVKHKEKLKKAAKEYYEKNKTKVKEANNKYRKKRPEIKRASTIRRRALKRQLGESFTPEDVQCVFYKFGNKCFRCNTTKNLTIDHHRPLSSRYVLAMDNAVLLCNVCNSKKAKKLPVDFYSMEELVRLNELGVNNES